MKKSIQTIALTTSCLCISFLSVAQLNLGLQSTTQAAANTMANTSAITKTTSAALNATKSTVASTNNTVQASSASLKNNIARTGKTVSLNSQTTVNTQANSGKNGNSLLIDKTVSAESGTNISIDRQNAMSQAGDAVNTTKEVKTSVQSNIKSNTTAVTREMKPNTNVSGEINSQTNTTVSKQ